MKRECANCRWYFYDEIDVSSECRLKPTAVRAWADYWCSKWKKKKKARLGDEDKK